MPRRESTFPNILSETQLAALIRQDRWSEEEARAIVQAWRRSGLSRKNFTEQFGVKAYRLEYWSGKVMRLEREAARSNAQAPVKVFPVRLTRSGARNPEVPDVDCPNNCIELVVPSGVRVRLGRDFDTQTLRRIMEAVGC